MCPISAKRKLRPRAGPGFGQAASDDGKLNMSMLPAPSHNIKQKYSEQYFHFNISLAGAMTQSKAARAIRYAELPYQ